MHVALHRTSLAFALVAAFVLAGCASTTKLDEPPVESRTPTTAGAGGAGADGAGAPQSQVGNVDLTNQQANAATLKTIYFDFDSFTIKPEYQSIVEANAKALVADRKKHMVAEGHTDERGGREYNLALGQKRAEAVVKAMTLLGAQPSQLEAVSYGEERPAAVGHDETAWAKNRRVELRDR